MFLSATLMFFFPPLGCCWSGLVTKPSAHLFPIKMSPPLWSRVWVNLDDSKRKELVSLEFGGFIHVQCTWLTASWVCIWIEIKWWQAPSPRSHYHSLLHTLLPGTHEGTGPDLKPQIEEVPHKTVIVVWKERSSSEFSCNTKRYSWQNMLSCFKSFQHSLDAFQTLLAIKSLELDEQEKTKHADPVIPAQSWGAGNFWDALSDLFNLPFVKTGLMQCRLASNLLYSQR